jgi:hypothetical protein
LGGTALLEMLEAPIDGLREEHSMFGLGHKTEMVSAEKALPGRDTRPWQLGEHVVLKTPVVADEVPDGYEVAIFGLGCFWGAEEIYWQLPGVWSTSVGYAGGITPNPTYEEVCTGGTGHTEAIRIVFDPSVISYADLVKRFFGCTTRHRACGRATTSALSTAPRSTGRRPSRSRPLAS